VCASVEVAGGGTGGSRLQVTRFRGSQQGDPRGPRVMSGDICAHHDWGAPSMEWVKTRSSAQ
jgi:hypothetical protein